MPRYGRILSRILLLLVIILLTLFALSFFTIRRSFPALKGEVKLSGLKSKVRVLRDRYGIPQIYASNSHDLFFAQGYVHAQDRFWQMDVWRHTGSGRLSEMFGESQIRTDKFLRTLGWEKTVQKELAQTDPHSFNILRAYAEGVNAYIKENQGSKLSLEYVLLSAINRDYRLEDWEPVHSLTFGKVMSWDLCMNMFTEIDRSILLKTLSPEQVDEIYPPYPTTGPFVVPNISNLSSNPTRAQIFRDPQVDAVMSKLQKTVEDLPNSIGIHGESIGSNNWVISGSKTTTGKPMLANDPHLGVQLPSIWYQVGLHCEPASDACPFDVTGFSFAGVPGIILGHNARIAWAMTNVGADVMDLYIEKINPENPNQYEFKGEWQEMKIIPDKIRVARGNDVSFSIRQTRHGAVISDTFSALENFDQKSGVQVPSKYAIALRWTALDVSDVFPAIWKMNVAKNWIEFRQAASEFDVPSQNLMYADVDGNIGYQTPGLIPVRSKGDGRFPVPGWTGEYEWTGYIPFDQLPSMFNPPEGFIVSANNQVISSEYPNLIAQDWETGFRASRIIELIQGHHDKIDKTFVQTMQGDNKNGKAAVILPYLLRLKIENVELKAPLELLRKWDHQQGIDSAAAAMFEVFWKNLMSETFHDDLPEDFWPGGSDRWGQVIHQALENGRWWDNRKTSTVETRDDILLISFDKAVKELRSLQGNDPNRWRWGALHTVMFRNETLGQSGIAVVESLLNRGPFESGGGTAVVNATGFNPLRSSFEVTALPSMRMIVDFSDFDQSLSMHTTGQSGHAYHENYIDMADGWRKVQYYQWTFGKKAVEQSTQNELVLTP
jgi:penicillin amidase